MKYYTFLEHSVTPRIFCLNLIASVSFQKRDLVHHGLQIVSEKFGLRFQVQGMRKIVSIAETYAQKNVLDRAALEAAMQEAYPKKGLFPLRNYTICR